MCAEQGVTKEGSSPSGVRMRSTVSKSRGNFLAGRKEWKVWRGLNGHGGESRKRTKADLNPSVAVSRGAGCSDVQRWNPKG